MSHPTPSIPARDPWAERLLVVLLAIAVVTFNVWTVQSVLSPLPSLFSADQQYDYANRTLDGFAAGHLYMPITPSAALLHVENPYDPAQRPPGSSLADVSFYHGHFYSYFGIAPTVTVLLPWRLLFGHELSEFYELLLFVNAAFLATVVLLVQIRRRYFPETSALSLGIAVIAVGMGSMTFAVLRRVSLWEPSIAAGYCFGLMALVALYQGLHASRRSRAWFAAASLSLGLAVGSRPTLIVGAIALLPIAWHRRPAQVGWWRSRHWWADLLALGAPLAAVLCGLFLYNFERFGSPFEFGMKYQLTGAYEQKVRHFSLSYVPFNAYIYYWARPVWSRYFPFIKFFTIPSLPAGYFTTEYVYGLCFAAPFAWFVALLPFAFARRPRSEQASLGAVVGSLFFYYAAVGAFLLCFVTSAARYAVDFMPFLMLLAALGLFSADRLLRGRLSCVGLRSAALVLVLVTALVGFFQNTQMYGILPFLNPSLYQKLGHAFDTPTHWIESRHAPEYGPLALTVRFPSDKTGATQPLVRTGFELQSDFVALRYCDAAHVQIGFLHIGTPTRWSGPIAVNYATAHRIVVSMGSLFPPQGHPLYDGWGDARYGSVGRWLHVSVDGVNAFDEAQDFYEGSPGSTVIGFEPAGIFGGYFTGKVLGTERLPVVRPVFPARPSGPVEIRLSIPRDSLGRRMPLVSIGVPGHADLLLLTAVAPGKVRFVYDHWGDPLLESPVVDLPDTLVHSVVVSMPAFYAVAPADSALTHRLLVLVDGILVGFQEVAAVTAHSGTLVFGEDGARAALCEAKYAWPIRSVKAASAVAAGSVVPWKPSGEREPPVDAISPPRPYLGGGARIALALWVALLCLVTVRLSGVRVRVPLRPAFVLLGRFWKPAAAATVVIVVICALWARHRAYQEAIGPLRLRVLLPTGLPGRSQPLVATGRVGAAAAFFVQYADSGHIRLGADIRGTVLRSDPIEVDYAKPVDITVSASGLYPMDHPGVHAIAPDVLERLRHTVWIAVNGQTVLSKDLFAYDSTVSELTVGRSSIGFSYCESEFDGKILHTERQPVPQELVLSRGEHVRFQYTPPSDQVGAVEPIASVGPKGLLGVCMAEATGLDTYQVVERFPDGRVRRSRLLPSDTTVHIVELTPGLATGSIAYPSLGVSVDGDALILSGGQRFLDATTVTVGMGICPEAGMPLLLAGEPLHPERVPASGIQRATEPADLELVVLFPKEATGADPLFVTGKTAAGDLLYVRYADAEHLVFAYDHWGVGGAVGSPIEVDRRYPHFIEVTGGVASGKIGAAPLKMTLDGHTVLETGAGFYPYVAVEAHVGENPIGASSCTEHFRGQILEAVRNP